MSALPLPGGGRRLLLELDLARGLAEAPPVSPLPAGPARRSPTLRAVVDGLARAADDARVVGLVAHVGHRHPSLAQSSELRQAVEAFRAAGKATVCWSESYGEMGPGNVGYHLASAFEQVWVQPTGDVGLTGVTAEAVFVRGTLDRLGIESQIGQRHEYKSAANTFLETAMTPAHREMVGRIVESAMDTVVADVAAGRRLTEAEVRAAVDAAPIPAEEALRRRLVDRLGYRDEVYADLRGRFGDVELKYVERYRKPLARAAQAGRSLARRSRPVVAVVHASGPIHLGRSTASPLAGRSIGSDGLGAALRAAADDDDIRAVVLRVNSPGGSYIASDAIRREVLALRRTGRPVVASMADVAASGGYYIAMPAEWVVADAGTLTGSIGVLAGKQVLREALARVGVTRESVSAGRYADMFSTQRPFDGEEWQRLQDWLDKIYADFTAKAAEDRRMPVARLREVAKGRVWTGADAVGLGLVDQVGGLADAVDAACRRVGLRRDQVDVRTLPRTSALDRLRPPQNSDSPAAARLGEGWPLLDAALAALQLPSYGVLTMPVTWRLR
ncbi:MAG: signal peptide peptidase SppA [Nocardioidaceae bacterium]